MRHFITFFLLFSTSILYAQLNEDFTDGDITNNPLWLTGNNGLDFTIVDGKLRSNSSVANNTFSVSTENTLTNNVQWEIWVNLQFSTSGSNFVDLYVLSDKADLKSTLINGYFIRIGNTDDEISLYKRSGTSASSIKIIDGINGSVGASNNIVRIRLKRDNIGNFTLEREVVASSSSFYTEGSVVDVSHITTSHFGIVVQQSSASFFLKHFFDNIKITQNVVDNIPPGITSISNPDSNTVEITFNEPMDSISCKTATNYTLSNYAGSILKVLTTNDAAKYHLKLSKALNTGTFTVFATNVKDKVGNIIATNNSGSFSYVKPYLVKFGDVTINEVFADPSPQVDLPSVEFLELRNNTDQILSLKNWKFVDSGTSSIFGEIVIGAQSFLIICAKSDTAEYKTFGKVLGISPWPSLNNAGELLKLNSPEDLLVDSVRYSDTWYRSPIKKQGGWTLERKHQSDKCEPKLNWFASVDSTGGTPGKENSIYVTAYDRLPLFSDSLKQISDTTLRIYFSKPLDSSTILTGNFALNPATSYIKRITVENDFKEVIITLDRKFQYATEYNLTVVNLKDCYGVPLTNASGHLKFKTNNALVVVERADTSKLIITEIFADPSPEVHLPLAEFIEIHNPTKDTVDLDKWTIGDLTTKSAIRNQKILPNEYLILCPAADTLQYKLFGRTIGLNPWPSLNNSSDQIALKSFKNRLVDSVSYLDTWYHNNTKKAGGWSLEKVDIKSVCENFFNWTASVDTIGGSPGKRNSVNVSGYDLIPLRADSIKLLTDTTLKIFFNKYLNPATLVVENFSLIPENTLKKISSDELIREVLLTYTKKFQPGTDYQVLIFKVSDCSGNTISTSLPLKFKTSMPQLVVERADTAKLIITEIFADPSPEVHLPLAEFIEIHNPTKDTVDLDKWTIGDLTTKSAIRNQKILPNEYLILCPAADTLQYKLFGRTIGLNPWPSLNNSSDQITLKSFKNRLVDSISYLDTWYHNNTKKAGGWSLEKVDIKSVCENFFNWTASVDTIGGSPGKRNSVNVLGYDHIPLKADSVKLMSDTSIKVFFNKYLNSASLLKENFGLTPSLSIKSLKPDQEFREVVIIYNHKFQDGTVYDLNVSGVKDCSGNFSSNPSTLQFKTSQSPLPIIERTDTSKLIITEIFADPSPEVHLPLAEFIEIHNPTKDTVDLDKWTIGDLTTKSAIRNQKILPNEYLILCPAADTLQYKLFGRTIGLNPWPSLNNSSDQLALKSFKNRLVDSVSYLDTWYHNNTKKAGGWSLEKVDLKSVCENFFNWTASVDTIGGSPGRKNSVNVLGYDHIPLKADSVKLMSDTSIKVFFNKYLNSASLLKENFGLTPSLSIKSLKPDQEFREVVIIYNHKFQDGTVYDLNVSGVKDCSGNAISTSLPLKFKTSMPPLVVERTDTSKLIITEIFADPSPEVHLPLAEFIEIHNPTKDTVDLDKWTIGDLTTKSAIRNQKILPNEYLILCPAADTLQYKLFGRTIGLNPWPSLNNSSDQIALKSFKNRLVDSVSYLDTWYHNNTKKAGGWSLEKVDIKSVCENFFNWTASVDTIGGSPGKRNSVNVSGYDLIPLRADSIKLLTDTTLKIFFNKYLNPATLIVENFNLIPENTLKKISSYELIREVLLTYTKKFQPGTDYQALVFKVSDCSGNTISTSLPLKFKTSMPQLVVERADTAKLIITEIFADPSPEVHLPLAEFIEIHNPTKDTVDLDKWTIGDLTTKSAIRNQKILPNEYLILCPAADTLQYKLFGRTIGLNPWPSLNNSSDQITLKSFKNRLVDSVSYLDTWYHNNTKKAGGWSLEKVDLKSVCENFFNWTASVDTIGGSPGKRNSVNVSGYDLIPLRADSIKLLTDTTLKIFFNKYLNPATLVVENFSLIPENTLKKISSDELIREVLLTYTKKFQPGTDYQVLIFKVSDCSGNTISNSLPLKFKTSMPPLVVERADTAKLIITEIFADPSPEVHLPLAEFIEIHNPTKDTVDLDKWTIGDLTTKSAIRNQKILPNEYLILCPAPDTLQYKLFGRTIGLNPWPSLNNSSDQITIKSFKNRLVDSISYLDTWYHNNTKKAGGWSLEKVDIKSVCENFFNWTASVDTIGGSPGKRNSVNVSGYDLIPLRADSIKLLTDTTLKIFFNKYLNPATLVVENFSLIPENTLKKISSDELIREVLLTYTKKFQPGTDYQVLIFKVSDCSGNTISTSLPLKFKTSMPQLVVERADTAKLIITEIFADPSPEVHLPLAEFIEIHNPTKDTVDLDKWTIGDLTTKSLISNTRIAPGAYLILCPVADTLQFKVYGNVKGISPWPTLGNTTDLITLKSHKQRLVDSVEYYDEWYKNKIKKNGGWSLEKSDLLQNYSCNGFYTWAAAVDINGGTPGRRNSVQKQEGTERTIKIDSISYSSDSTVAIHLNSIPDTSYMKARYFTIDKGIGYAYKASFGDDYLTVQLQFINKFQEGIEYILKADSLFNCAGNGANAKDTHASFTIPAVPELDYPVLINEIFADPSPQVGMPEAEYVELYNASEKPVSLKGMYYGNEFVQHQFVLGEIPSKSFLILCAVKDTVYFTPLGKTLGLPLWPTLGNEKGTLIIKNNKGRQIQKVTYNFGWYRETDKKSGGYSLESVNPASICMGAQNWSASKDPAGGTPGKQNSLYDDRPPQPLKLVESVITDSITILLTFNRSVDSLSSSDPNNYTLNNGVGSPEFVLPASTLLEQVILKFRKPFARGHTYKIEANNIVDCTGYVIQQSANHHEFILTEKIFKDNILISEILFNPRLAGVDFIEIYNNTKHTLDLQELSIATMTGDSINSTKRISTKQLLIESGKYFALTSAPEIIKKEYSTNLQDRVIKASLPPLNDDKGTVLLLNDNTIVDMLNFNEKMHFQLLKSFEGVSLERSSLKLNTNEAGNFRSATAAAGFATPGYQNSQYNPISIPHEEFALASKTFSPDNDGFEDVLQVTYRFTSPGMVANVKIFNDKGIIVRNLLRNTTLNSEGIIIWDGLDEVNTAVATGIYVIYAEIFDSNGNLKRFRKSFALAAKL